MILGQDIGAAELVEHGRNGLLCDPANDSSIRLALEIIAGDRAAAMNIGRQARETILNVSWDHCADRTFAVYERVCGELPVRRR